MWAVCRFIEIKSPQLIPSDPARRGGQWKLTVLRGRQDQISVLSFWPVPRHTWSISSKQWVSNFASGASSLGRPRRLAGYPAKSGPPSSEGKIRRELPSYI